MYKIYFGASIRGGRQDAAVYPPLIAHLQRRYGRVLTEHIGFKGTVPRGQTKKLTDREIHSRDMNWFNESDVMVAEVSRPSLGVGYEIGRMVERNEALPLELRVPILCLYRRGSESRLSAMIRGSDGATAVDYSTVSEAKKLIDVFFSELGQSKPDTVRQTRSDPDL